jgi:excisionase family DNA binding protein
MCRPTRKEKIVNNSTKTVLEPMVYTIDEVAEILRLSRKTVRERLLKTGRLRYLKMGKSIIRVPKAAMLDFLKE